MVHIPEFDVIRIVVIQICCVQQISIAYKVAIFVYVGSQHVFGVHAVSASGSIVVI